jgi:hypothetical protein
MATHRPPFTPPPWHAEPYRAHDPKFAVFAGPNMVAGRIQSEDDAQLIEAAPDLYGAAEAALDWLKLIGPTSPVTARLERALDKAVIH